MGIKMKIIRQAAGNHDARVLSGDGVRLPDPKTPNDAGAISWSGGEIVIVTEELAEAFEASGMAERVIDEKAAKPKPAAARQSIAKAQPAAGLELRKESGE